MWISCIATLREEMYMSNSPMVGAAPFFNVTFIFVAAWLSYAFLGAAVAHKRKYEGRAPIRWAAPAFWFAVIISLLSVLYYTLCSRAGYVGCICPEVTSTRTEK